MQDNCFLKDGILQAVHFEIEIRIESPVKEAFVFAGAIRNYIASERKIRARNLALIFLNISSY